MPAPRMRVPAAERGRLLQRILFERARGRDGQRLQVRAPGVCTMRGPENTEEEEDKAPVPPDHPEPTAPVEDPRPEPPPAGDPPAQEPTRLV